MHSGSEWHGRLETVVPPVYGESEFQSVGMKMKALRGDTRIYAVQSVACDRHSEPHYRGRVNPKLVGTPGKGMEHHSASPFGYGDEFIIGLGWFPTLDIYALAWSVEPVGGYRQRDMPLRGYSM